jgi:hypothetical protein
MRPWQLDLAPSPLVYFSAETMEASKAGFHLSLNDAICAEQLRCCSRVKLYFSDNEVDYGKVK